MAMNRLAGQVLRLKFGLLPLILLVTLLAGCVKASYPKDEIISSIQKICRNEYGIEHVEVKIIGHTVGVLLPLDKLFTADVRELVMSGDIDNIESLFEPTQEAMERLEDVLFTISRAPNIFAVTSVLCEYDFTV